MTTQKSTLSEMVKMFLWRQKNNLLKITRMREADKLYRKQRPYIKWARSDNLFGIEQYCRIIDAPLWREVDAECGPIETYGHKVLSELPPEFQSAGAASCRMIYFMVRKFRPKIVVETGVSAGWSSLAILRAFQRNGGGRLFSSDLPDAGSRDAQHYIGILARNEPNRACWDLDIGGDGNALPRIVEKLGDEKIDLLHFDSDKSYSGREFVVSTLMDRLSDEALVIFDDINDNFHFRDFVRKFDLDYVVLDYAARSYRQIGNIRTHIGVIPQFGRQIRAR